MSTLSSTDTYLCFGCERTMCIERSPFVTKCKVRIPPIPKASLIKPDDEVDRKNDEIEFVKVADSVEHPIHYTQNGIECIEAIKASMTADGFMDYCKGNVLKYIWRWRDKGGVEDLEKARVYLGWMIEEAKK